MTRFEPRLVQTKDYNSGYLNRIGGVMVSMLASNTVDRGLDSRSDQIKDY